MKPLYDQRCSPSASDTILLVAKGLKHEIIIRSVNSLDTVDVPLDPSACYRYGNYFKVFEPGGWYDHIVGFHEFIFKRRFTETSIFEIKKLFLFFLFMISLLGLLPAYAVSVVVTGPTTVCPKNDNLHIYKVKSYQVPSGSEVTCGVYDWTVLKNGVIIEERTLYGADFTFRFDDIGNYQISVVASQCGIFSGGSTSITVNSRVKMPNPITGPTICNTGQAYSFSTSPPLPSTDNDCNYHYANLWTAPSGWKINGGGNTLFAHASTVSLIAPVGTPAGSYTISVQSSIPYGTPSQSNSWFSTPRTYTVIVGPFNSSQISVSGTVAVCGGNTYTYNANVPGGHRSGYTYNWTYPAGWVVQYAGANTIQLYVPSNNSSYGTVRVSVNNGCGSPSPYSGVTVYPCNYMAAGNFLIYPNPSEGELNVEYFDEKEDSSLEENNFTEGVFQIELYDKQENLVRTAESKSGKVNLETNNMQPGAYFLQIRTGKEVFRKQILIK